MKNFFFIVGMVVCTMAYAETNGDAQKALKNGAIGRYVYTIVDDAGLAVSNASAHVWFKSYGRPQDCADWVVETNSNGMFEVEHRFNEKFSVGIDKDGYYHAHDEINYLTLAELPVKDGKWQPFGQRRTAVLKRILKPHDMLGPSRTLQRKISVYDRWLGFDLEKADFLPPIGDGRDTDMLIRFRKEGQMPYEWSIGMDVTFTNHPYAGAYRLKKDRFSDMKSPYYVDTNATYLTTFSFRFSRTRGARPVTEKLDADELLVFRTRTKIDSEGRLLSARYGKIYGPWHFEDAGGMRISKVFMNGVDDDINLEDEETARRTRRAYRKNGIHK